MKVLVWISRLLVGALFIFSGFVKLVDPLGFSYKLVEYFTVFHLQFLNPTTVWLSILMSCLEVVLGVSIILGTYRNRTNWLLLLLIIFFTFLTGYTAITGQVTDCGCFGDALKVTPVHSFIKDLVLLAFIIFLFVYRHKMSRLISRKVGYPIVWILAAAMLGLSIYCYLYLPIIDFRPYKVGNDIKMLMTATPGKFKTTLIYKNNKTGETKGFSVNDIPSDTNTWTWVKTDNEQIEAPKEAPIHDFAIFNYSGDDLTPQFMDQEGPRILIVQNRLKQSNTNAQPSLDKLANELIQSGVHVWALTSSSASEINNYKEKYHVPYPYYIADGTVLKTIVRSNPGILLFDGTTIMGKWPSRNIPSKDEVLNKLK